MKKIYYNTETEKEEILAQAKQNAWILKEDAITIYGKYLAFDTKTDEKVIQLETALLEITTLLADEQMKNTQNEQAILELTTLMAGVLNNVYN